MLASVITDLAKELGGRHNDATKHSNEKLLQIMTELRRVREGGGVHPSFLTQEQKDKLAERDNEGTEDDSKYLNAKTIARLHEIKIKSVNHSPLLEKYHTFPIDRMVEELAECSSRKNNVSNAVSTLTAFMRSYPELLCRLKFNLCRRWARFALGIGSGDYPHMKDLHELSDRFVGCLGNIKKVYNHASKSKRKLNLNSRDIRSKDIELYLRWIIPYLSNKRATHKFLFKLKWLYTTKTNQIGIRTKEIETSYKDEEDLRIRRKIELLKENEYTIPEDINDDNNYYDVPLFPINEADLDAAIHRVQKHGSQTTKLNYEHGHPLLLHVLRLFPIVFEEQKKRRSFRDQGAEERDESEQYQLTFIAKANWIPFMKFDLNLDEANILQSERLHALSQIDVVLAAENAFVDSTDLTQVQARLKKMASTYATSLTERKKTRLRDEGSIASNLYDITRALREADETSPPSPKKSKSSKEEKEKKEDGQKDQNFRSGVTDAGGARPEYYDLPIHKLHTLFTLRYLHVRSLKQRILCILNFFRSIERRLTLDDHGYSFEDPFQFNADHIVRTLSLGAPSPFEKLNITSNPFKTRTTKKTRLHVHSTHYLPTDYESECDAFMEFAGIERRDDSYEMRSATDTTIGGEEKDNITVIAANGMSIAYDAAIIDLKELEEEVLAIGSYYIQRHRKRYGGGTEEVTTEAEIAQQETSCDVVDRWELLIELYENELKFAEAKSKLLDCYLEAYEHAIVPETARRLAQRIIELIKLRVHLSLQDHSPSFDVCYDLHIRSLQKRTKLLEKVIRHQMHKEKVQAKQHGGGDWRAFLNPVNPKEEEEEAGTSSYGGKKRSSPMTKNKKTPAKEVKKNVQKVDSKKNEAAALKPTPVGMRWGGFKPPVHLTINTQPDTDAASFRFPEGRFPYKLRKPDLFDPDEPLKRLIEVEIGSSVTPFCRARRGEVGLLDVIPSLVMILDVEDMLEANTKRLIMRRAHADHWSRQCLRLAVLEQFTHEWDVYEHVTDAIASDEGAHHSSFLGPSSPSSPKQEDLPQSPGGQGNTLVHNADALILNSFESSSVFNDPRAAVACLKAYSSNRKERRKVAKERDEQDNENLDQISKIIEGVDESEEEDEAAASHEMFSDEMKDLVEKDKAKTGKPEEEALDKVEAFVGCNLIESLQLHSRFISNIYESITLQVIYDKQAQLAHIDSETSSSQKLQNKLTYQLAARKCESALPLSMAALASTDRYLRMDPHLLKSNPIPSGTTVEQAAYEAEKRGKYQQRLETQARQEKEQKVLDARKKLMRAKLQQQLRESGDPEAFGMDTDTSKRRSTLTDIPRLWRESSAKALEKSRKEIVQVSLRGYPKVDQVRFLRKRLWYVRAMRDKDALKHEQAGKALSLRWLDLLRRVHSCQVAHTYVLTVAVQYHEALRDMTDDNKEQDKDGFSFEPNSRPDTAKGDTHKPTQKRNKWWAEHRGKRGVLDLEESDTSKKGALFMMDRSKLKQAVKAVIKVNKITDAFLVTMFTEPDKAGDTAMRQRTGQLCAEFFFFSLQSV